MSILEVKKLSLAADVRFSSDTMYIQLSDGREIGIPLEWYPRLRDAILKRKEKIGV